LRADANIVTADDARAAVTYDRMVPPATFKDYRKWVARHMDVLNAVTEGILMITRIGLVGQLCATRGSAGVMAAAAMSCDGGGEYVSRTFLLSSGTNRRRRVPPV
jgi:hypothetical protein